MRLYPPRMLSEERLTFQPKFPRASIVGRAPPPPEVPRMGCRADMSSWRHDRPARQPPSRLAPSLPTPETWNGADSPAPPRTPWCSPRRRRSLPSLSIWGVGVSVDLEARNLSLRGLTMADSSRTGPGLPPWPVVDRCRRSARHHLRPDRRRAAERARPPRHRRPHRHPQRRPGARWARIDAGRPLRSGALRRSPVGH